jgi:DNA-damage-inducible protein J
MAKTETIRARVEPELKRGAEAIFKVLGLSPTEAITLFYKQVTLRRGLPFSVEIPNAETLEAMHEALKEEELKEWPDLEALKRAQG